MFPASFEHLVELGKRRSPSAVIFVFVGSFSVVVQCLLEQSKTIRRRRDEGLTSERLELLQGCWIEVRMRDPFVDKQDVKRV